MTVRVIQGDCLEVMPTLDAESIDAIVCDPPYGLSFMGKAWDHGVPGVDFWIEAIRVAKPGAYLLAFGGTRTFHRLTCAIEDAGWEIRDCLSFLYGSGFPKSLNIGCKCNEAKPTTERDVRPLRGGNVPPTVNATHESSETLFPRLPQSDIQANGKTRAESETTTRQQSCVEGRRHVQAVKGELHRPEVRPVSTSVHTDGAEGRLRNGASASNGSDARALFDTDRGSPSPRPQHEEQLAGKPSMVPGQRHAQESRGICEACSGLTDWRGWGTALKPAWEPIILARKPFKQTVAANVREHGTGALNIDGCRIEGVPFHSPRTKPGFTSDRGWNDNSMIALTPAINTSGRWPANVCLDEEAAAMLDESAPDTGTFLKPGTRFSGGANVNAYGKATDREFIAYGDRGGASRFFYTAKAGRSEREEGLEGQAHRPRADVMSMNSHDHECGIDGRGQPYKIAPVKNNHPTVKPLDLMRWLVRLVAPPNGVVLDPFMGSGTTGIAAVLESKRFIGIEKEAEYCAIAEKRIAHWGAQGILDLGGVA